MGCIEPRCSPIIVSHVNRTTFLGLGEMGSALAGVSLSTGRPVTVWNRSEQKAAALAERGATVARTVDEAVASGDVIVACLLDHGSVHDVLDPHASRLAGRALVNLTTTTPNQARELAEWSAAHGIRYLDGGIMAVPAMIGGAGSSIFYSGSGSVFEEQRPLLEEWGEASFFGTDAGTASLYDLAILAGMYTMFAGFMHGAAMVGAEGGSAADFAARATPFLAAMTGAFGEFAAVIDSRDYAGEGQQSLEFSDLGDLLQASADQGVSVEVIEPVQRLIRRQIAAGHGAEGFARIYEELRA
jgi:3-hydroxyisobutyrate dehydrogenase-like beta-hydroxyacid dehydrogenase